MRKLTITYLEDYQDCETCGGSGATGFRVFLNDKEIVTLLPIAYCYDATSYSEMDLLREVVKYFAPDVEVEEA